MVGSNSQIYDGFSIGFRTTLFKVNKMKLFASITILLISAFFNILNAKELKLDDFKNLHSKVFFMRHALAPGNGDPKNFKLDDCSTQRNLSSDGINQARKISNEFTKYDLKFTQLLPLLKKAYEILQKF